MQAHSPFGTAKAPVTKSKTKTGYRTRVNPEDLEICDDPIPTKRQPPSQYDDIFAKMKPGSVHQSGSRVHRHRGQCPAQLDPQKQEKGRDRQKRQPVPRLQREAGPRVAN